MEVLHLPQVATQEHPLQVVAIQEQLHIKEVAILEALHPKVGILEHHQQVVTRRLEDMVNNHR